MKIGEVASALGLSVQTLRFYEKQELLDTQKTEGGTRQYSSDDLQRIRAIRALTRLGLPLDQLQRLAHTRLASDSGDQACRSVSRQLNDMVASLQQLRSHIDQALADIQQADQLVQQCRDCQVQPRRRNCAPCPVSTGLNRAQILQLIWDQDHEQ